MLRTIFAGKTDIGLKRTNNEDVFSINPEREFCLAADGVGGAAAGELASKIFAESTLEIFSGQTDRSAENIKDRVQKAFRLANQNIQKHVTQNPKHKGMACTAELLAFSDEEDFILGHIGDSRTYRLRNGQLEQLTQDHTFIQQQIDEGLISQDNIKYHPLRNVIFRAVGLMDDADPDVLNGKTYSKDLFMLCSDGLTDLVRDDQIQEILSSNSDIQTKAQKLIDQAKVAGGYDNITVVLALVN